MKTNQYNLNITSTTKEMKSISLVNKKTTSSQPSSEKSWAQTLSTKKLSSLSISSMETFFEWYGRKLATHPFKSIALCLLIPALCAIGLVSYKTENNPYKLWIPQDSDYIRNHEWLWSNFPPDTRFNSIIVTADNVLTPQIIRKLFEVHEKVVNITSKDGRDWEDVCYRVPYIDLEPLQFLLDDLNDAFDYDYEEEDDSGTSKTNNTLNVTNIIDDNNEEEKDTTTPKTNEEIDVTNTIEPNKLSSGNTKASDTTIEPRIENLVTEQSESISRARRDLNLGFDPSIDLYPDDYCGLIQDLTTLKCLENSLLELWAEDDYGTNTKEVLEKLTEQDIINAVNNLSQSKVYGRHQDFTKYLGSIQRNETGHIVGAKATYIRFIGKVNISAIGGDMTVQKGSPVDQYTLNWEEALIDTLTQDSNNSSSFDFFYNVAKSFTDLSEEAINGDAFIFGVGTGIVFVYVQMMLGRFNFVEQRPGLSAAGIGCCALGILTSYGFCSGINLVFSPMHAIIPFLMLGIGIDDMFVIVQCYNNIVKQKENQDLSHEHAIGLTMKHAGVAITITSFTNVLVFAIGAFTVLPALQSFCLYCAVGIAAVYVYQATIFTALFSVDTKRIASMRNGCLPFIVHKNWVPNKLSQKDLAQATFEKLGEILMHPVSKCLVILTTVGLVSVGGWALSNLRTEFNPIWFIPQESYLAGWFQNNRIHFPKEGERVKINIADIDYTSELPKIESLVNKLSQETTILSSVDSWYLELKHYTEKNDLLDGGRWEDIFQKEQLKFYQILTQFLFSPTGAKYRGSFNFVNDLVCGEAASEIQLSSIELTHKLFSGPSEWIPAMNRIKTIVAEANFSSRAFPVGTEYASWETDEIISEELYRNMGLSLVCVFVTTVLLIANIPACLIVLLCVVLTLVNVGGFMHLWGLTIDVISCINLVIAVGLTVDYSAHITHCFVRLTGTREERAVKTLRDIGPAVLNGGFSTFLAFILTAGSASHVFSTFFKIFFLVVLFGLYHALVFLPVLLSLVGPKEPMEEVRETAKEVLDTDTQVPVEDIKDIVAENKFENVELRSWKDLRSGRDNMGFDSEESSVTGEGSVTGGSHATLDTAVTSPSETEDSSPPSTVDTPRCSRSEPNENSSEAKDILIESSKTIIEAIDRSREPSMTNGGNST